MGALIPDINQPILLVTDEGREEEVVTRLARVGFDNALGYLKGGLNAWVQAGEDTDQISSVSALDLALVVKSGNGVKILDIRRASEYISEHISDAENFPLDDINDNMTAIDKEQTYYVHCAGGYRSMIFNSIMRARGFVNLIDVKGGFKAIKETGNFTLLENVCQSSQL